LLCHAKSSWADPTLDVPERPLARRGRRPAGTHRRALQVPSVVRHSCWDRLAIKLFAIYKDLPSYRTILDREGEGHRRQRGPDRQTRTASANSSPNSPTPASPTSPQSWTSPKSVTALSRYCTRHADRVDCSSTGNRMDAFRYARCRAGRRVGAVTRPVEALEFFEVVAHSLQHRGVNFVPSR
jgi:hypothetical protein